MTTFQDQPPQSRRSARQSERGEEPDTPTGFADADVSTPASEQHPTAAFAPAPPPLIEPGASGEQPLTRSGRRAREAAQQGLYEVQPTDVQPTQGEPLDYMTQGRGEPLSYQAPEPQLPPAPRPEALAASPIPSASPDQAETAAPQFRVRDFSPEGRVTGRRAAAPPLIEPGSAPSAPPSDLEYRTEVGPATVNIPADEVAPVAVPPAAALTVPTPIIAVPAEPSAEEPTAAEPIAEEPTAAEPSAAEPTMFDAEPAIASPEPEPQAASESHTLTRREMRARLAEESAVSLDQAPPPAPASAVSVSEAPPSPVDDALVTGSQPPLLVDPAVVTGSQPPADVNPSLTTGSQPRPEIHPSLVTNSQPPLVADSALVTGSQPRTEPSLNTEFSLNTEPSLNTQPSLTTGPSFRTGPQAPPPLVTAAPPPTSAPRFSAAPPPPAPIAPAPVATPVSSVDDEESDFESLSRSGQLAPPSASQRIGENMTPAAPNFLAPMPEPELDSDLEHTGGWVPPIGHWSRQADLDDETQPWENTVTREVGGGNVATTTSALVLPEMPRANPFPPALNATGEILLTGSIELPRSLSAVGGDSRHFDDSDVDLMYDDKERELAGTDSSPVSAIRAVSTHTSARGVISSSNKPHGNRMLTVLLITAAVMAVGVVGLLIAGLSGRIF